MREDCYAFTRGQIALCHLSFVAMRLQSYGRRVPYEPQTTL